MPPLTPMLALMAGKSADRQRRYVEAKQKQGLVKRTYWVPEHLADDVRDAMRFLEIEGEFKTETNHELVKAVQLAANIYRAVRK